MIKNVLLWTASVICCVAVVVVGAYCSTQRDTAVCNKVYIVVQDSLIRQFVDAEELELFLMKKSCYPQGESMNTIDCHEIERCLLAHEMVRQVECYKTPLGHVNIAVKQRVPILGVISNNGCYFVDSDRRLMPVRGEMDHLPVFSGAVSERAAREEYFDFAMWLMEDDFWAPRIRGIHVNNPKNIVLSQTEKQSKIILGEIVGFDAKLYKLQKLYTKGFDRIGYPECKEYDLRFANQVVCRK